MASIEQPRTAESDRQVLSELGRPRKGLPDPRQFEGRYLTPEIEEVIRSHERPERKPWTLDTPVGKDETAGDVLRRHHFGKDSEQRELPPETAKRNQDHVADNAEKSPWLTPAADADPLVQSIYVERDQSVGHDLQRHEGWRGTQGQFDRAKYQRDPAHPTDSPEYLRSNDAFGQGRLHECWGYATHIPDPVAYTTAYARILEHPKVKESLSRPFDPENEPPAIRDIPIEEILGSDGHTAINGFELIGDDMKESTSQRRQWMRAIRAAIDDGSTFEKAVERVRSTAVENNLPEPFVRPVDTFAGGTFTVQFDLNRAESGYEIMSFYASPRRVEQ
jgi:hypothetical protein